MIQMAIRDMMKYIDNFCYSAQLIPFHFQYISKTDKQLKAQKLCFLGYYY